MFETDKISSKIIYNVVLDILVYIYFLKIFLKI